MTGAGYVLQLDGRPVYAHRAAFLGAVDGDVLVAKQGELQRRSLTGEVRWTARVGAATDELHLLGGAVETVDGKPPALDDRLLVGAWPIGAYLGYQHAWSTLALLDPATGDLVANPREVTLSDQAYACGQATLCDAKSNRERWWRLGEHHAVERVSQLRFSWKAEVVSWQDLGGHGYTTRYGADPMTDQDVLVTDLTGDGWPELVVTDGYVLRARELPRPPSPRRSSSEANAGGTR